MAHPCAKARLLTYYNGMDQKTKKITEPGVTQLHAYGEKKIQETPVEIMAYFRIG